jgi:geranylgeranyl reductase family protein
MTLTQSKADYFDAIIVGAGPSGSSCAVYLSRMGLRVLLVDREHFPRDKVCGDGVSGKSMSMLRELGLIEEIELLPHVKIPDLELTSPDGTGVDITLTERDGSPEYGYCIRRELFDDAVFQYAKKHVTGTIEGFTVRELIRESTGSGEKVIGVKGRSVHGDEEEFRSSVVVGADGFNGAVSRELGVRQLDPAHLFVCIRGYFRGVKDLKPRIELHFLKETVPGYFWIFPVEKDLANVGLAMTVEDVRKKQTNPMNQLLDVLKNNSAIVSRFKDSVMIDSSLKAGVIPCGSKRVRSYGDGWLLVGDAASLADPLTGEGIGNALYSGKLAAETILKAHDRNDYSRLQLSSYEQALRDAFDSQLRNSSLIQRRAKNSSFVNLVIRKAAGSRGLRELMADWLNNPVERKSYISRFSYLRIVLTPPYW